MILITGGIKSGKSTLAVKLARECAAPRIFIATGVPMDHEFEKRIAIHQKERGDDFILFEEPTEIFKPLTTVTAGVFLIDCITLWVNNLLYHKLDVDRYIEKLASSLTGKEIFVTNEVGWGVIPDNELARKYIDAIGKTNALLAQRADAVYLMVSGIPTRIK